MMTMLGLLPDCATPWADASGVSAAFSLKTHNPSNVDRSIFLIIVSLVYYVTLTPSAKCYRSRAAPAAFFFADGEGGFEALFAVDTGARHEGSGCANFSDGTFVPGDFCGELGLHLFE